MATDSDIGRNLARIRGATSQKDLADAMRKRGFRWSQATVWAIEKGERPLRLTEAEAVGSVFGIHPQTLLSAEEELELTTRLQEFTSLMEEIYELAYQSYEGQRELANYIDFFTSDDIEGIVKIDIVRRTAADVAVEALARAAEHRRGPLDLDRQGDVPVSRSAGRYVVAFDERVRELTESDLGADESIG